MTLRKDIFSASLAVVCILAAMAAVQFAQAQDRKPPSKSLDVAAVLALSGYASVHGHNIQRGLEMAKFDLEKQGWQVRLTYEDDGTVPVRSVSTVRSLMARGLRLFIGPTWSFQVAAAAPLYAAGPVLAFSPATCSAVAGGPRAHLLHGITPVPAIVAPLTAWLKGRKARRIAILYASCAWGEEHRKAYETAASEAGAEVVYNDHFEYGDEDGAIPIMLGKIKAAAPDVILSTSSAEGVGVMVRRMAELKMKSPLLSTDDMNDALQQKLIDFRGAPPLYTIALPVEEQFRVRYAKHFGEAAGIYSDIAYDGLMLFARAAEMTDGTPRAMEQFLRKLPGYTGVSGRFDFDQNGDVKKGNYVISEIRPLGL